MKGVIFCRHLKHWTKQKPDGINTIMIKFNNAEIQKILNFKS